MGTWSSGMILALGARGREFDSRSAPQQQTIKQSDVEPLFFESGFRLYFASKDYIGSHYLGL